MKAVSLWQPWASFCVVPDRETGIVLKPDETRSWAPPLDLVGHRIAIHATASCPLIERPVTAAGFFWEPYASLVERIGYSPQDPWHRWSGARSPVGRVPLGVIVGVVTLYRVAAADDRARHICDTLPAFRAKTALELGDYSVGRFAWVFTAQHALDEPIPCKGRQGIWTVPDPIGAAISERLAA